MKPLNRANRRKVANHIVKRHEESKRKAQYGFGLVITNLMFVVTFWNRTWVLYDRRLS